MATVRRIYIYLVSAISLQSAVWAFIALLRNFLITRLDPDVTALAFQIAVLVVGLPIFLIHWFWGQRVRQDRNEQEASLRRFYLYATLAGFLAPWITNFYDLLGSLLKANGSLERLPNRLSATDGIFYHLFALLVLGVLWFYHHRVLAEEQQTIPDQERNATLRRLYVLGFSLAGLFATGLGIIHLIRWLMFQVGPSVGSNIRAVILVDELIRLAVGGGLWFIFWRWGGKLFETGGEEERESALRKLYLYGTVLYSTIGVVANSAGILAGVFRRILSLPPESSLHGSLPIILGLGMVWAYHAFVLRDDASKLTEIPRQAGIRRLYLYLIAFVGLCALLTGIVGDLNVLLRSFDQGLFGTELREQLAVFTAALLAGLPVWVIPWRRIQAETDLADVPGLQAQQSLVRKIYLYFFLFLGTMTILSSAVFILYGLFLSLLGEEPPTFLEIAQAVSYMLIAMGVLAYHGFTLRGDGQSSKTARTANLASLNLLVLDVEDGKEGLALTNILTRENPGYQLAPLFLKKPTEAEPTEEDLILTQIQNAGVIVAPWSFALPHAGVVSPTVAHALAHSPARKLLLPTPLPGWDWAGVDRWTADQQAQQTLRALQQILEGEPVNAHRPMGILAIIGLTIGGLYLVGLLFSFAADFLF